MKSVLRILMLVLVLAPAVVDAREPIVNLEDVPISMKADGTSFTLQEARAAIIRGCVAGGWAPFVDSEGVIHASLNVRDKHFAEVDITVTPTTYSVQYVSSKNLDYRVTAAYEYYEDPYGIRQKRHIGQRFLIHENYNIWIAELSNWIKKELHAPSQNASPTPGEPHSSAVTERDQSDVYSKILMLDDMRNRGILTDEEFYAEKKKLLNGN